MTSCVTITARALTVGYGRTTILHNMDFGPLETGKVIGLIGPNAAGKSTLVKTIAGIKRPQSGTCSVTVGSKVVEGRERTQAIGYVPQDLLATASLTTFESVMVSARRSEVEEWDPISATADTLERLGITYLSDRLISEMSGGQRQLVGVAQMLVRHPNILLLDEPTSALDIHHQVHLLEIVREEVRGTDRLAVVAIHDLNLAARFCDELLVIKGGRAIAHDKPKTVLTPELLHEVYDIDARILYDADVPVICPV